MRHGSPYGGVAIPLELRDDAAFCRRFWAKATPDPRSRCWVWSASTASGYGKIKLPGTGRSFMAHRVAFTLVWAPIPPRWVVDHRCHNTLCINPDHLRACEQSFNIQEARFGRSRRKKKS